MEKFWTITWWTLFAVNATLLACGITRKVTLGVVMASACAVITSVIFIIIT